MKNYKRIYFRDIKEQE